MRFRDRGVYHFAGRVRCPFAGLGTRGDHEGNRLALDDDRSRVDLDTGAGRIVLYNDHVYPQKAVIGDVLFLAEGTTASGRKRPFSVHLKVLKKGRASSFDLHRHLRADEPLVAANFEPFEVIVEDAVTRVVALTPDRTRALCLRPSLALRVVRSIMATRDLLQGVAQDPAQVGYRVADLSVGFGALGVHHGVVRARLVSLDAANAPLIRRGSVPEMLREGSWEPSITALSKRWLDEVIARDLFLFGLEGGVDLAAGAGARARGGGDALVPVRARRRLGGAGRREGGAARGDGRGAGISGVPPARRAPGGARGAPAAAMTAARAAGAAVYWTVGVMVGSGSWKATAAARWLSLWPARPVAT